MEYWHTIWELVQSASFAIAVYVGWHVGFRYAGLFRNHKSAWLILNEKVEGILNAKDKDDTTH